MSDNALLLLDVEILLVLATGGFGVYRLVWELTRSRGAAVVTGIPYTGVGFRISSVNLGHVHTLALHLTPLVLVMLLRPRRDRSPRTTQPELWRAGVGTGVGLLLAVPVLWPYIELRQAHPDFSDDPQETLELSATPGGSYLSPALVGKIVGGLYGELSERFGDTHPSVEKELFPGLWLSEAPSPP